MKFSYDGVTYALDPDANGNIRVVKDGFLRKLVNFMRFFKDKKTKGQTVGLTYLMGALSLVLAYVNMVYGFSGLILYVSIAVWLSFVTISIILALVKFAYAPIERKVLTHVLWRLHAGMAKSAYQANSPFFDEAMTLALNDDGEISSKGWEAVKNIIENHLVEQRVNKEPMKKDALDKADSLNKTLVEYRRMLENGEV